MGQYRAEALLLLLKLGPMQGVVPKGRSQQVAGRGRGDEGRQCGGVVKRPTR